MHCELFTVHSGGSAQLCVPGSHQCVESPECTANNSQRIPDVQHLDIGDALQIRDVEVHCVGPQQLVSIPF